MRMTHFMGMLQRPTSLLGAGNHLSGLVSQNFHSLLRSGFGTVQKFVKHMPEALILQSPENGFYFAVESRVF